MEKISKILKDRRSGQNKNLHSEIHDCADIISDYFGERKKFAMYLGIVKRVGVSEARRIFAEVRQANCRQPAKLFLWKSRKTNL